MSANLACGMPSVARMLCRPDRQKADPEATLRATQADARRPDADLGGIGAPVFKVDHGFGRGDVAGDDECLGQPRLDVVDGAAHAVCVAVREVAWAS